MVCGITTRCTNWNHTVMNIRHTWGCSSATAHLNEKLHSNLLRTPCPAAARYKKYSGVVRVTCSSLRGANSYWWNLYCSASSTSMIAA